MLSNDRIHQSSIPLGYALVWGIGLLCSLFGFSIIDSNKHSEQFMYLFAAYNVFLIFLGEVVLSFADIASIYSDQRIKGEVFWVFSKLFLIVILIAVISFIYYKFAINIYLLGIVLSMGWMKWEISRINNNIDNYIIPEEGITLIGNKI